MSDTNAVTLADVFNAGFEHYCDAHDYVPVAHRKIAQAIMSCRTQTQGGRLYTCDECDKTFILYHSCRNRHCPKCQATARAAWVSGRREELLNVNYHHIVFTVPQQLKPFARAHKETFYSLMFKAVSETLLALGADRKHLGGTIGIIAILHTWTQTLAFHPHIHCIVPSGALAPDGVEWIGAKSGCMFPFNVVKQLYRGKFMALFREALKAKQIIPTATRDQPSIKDTINMLYQTDWVVYMEESYKDPDQVIKYLAGYTNRIAISDRRIKRVDSKTVTFSYRDRRDNNREKEMVLPIVSFIRRFLEHAVPSGFVRIRYYGLFANRDRAEKIALCRMAIDGVEYVCEVDEQGSTTHEASSIHAVCCPHCRCKRMKRVEEIPKDVAAFYRKSA